jgi:hypothetical protein
MSTDTVSTEFCLRLAQAWVTLSRRLDNALGSHHGIGFADYLLLLRLQRAPDGRLSRRELAYELGMSVAGWSGAAAIRRTPVPAWPSSRQPAASW